MNLPNKLTLLRVAMIPVFMIFAALGGTVNLLIAGIIFSIASLTDFFDGYLARKNNLVTDFGKFADPLADKLLTTVAFIYMLVDGVCSPIVLTIILAREFAVSGVRMVAASAPKSKVIAANMWGKLKTVTQMVTVCFYYFASFFEASFIQNQAQPYFYTQIISYVLCWIVALVTLVSGVQYIFQNKEYINTAK